VISPLHGTLPDNTHNTHKQQTSMSPAGFEPAIPASEGPQNHALDRCDQHTTESLTKGLWMLGTSINYPILGRYMTWVIKTPVNCLVIRPYRLRLYNYFFCERETLSFAICWLKKNNKKEHTSFIRRRKYYIEMPTSLSSPTSWEVYRLRFQSY
jgi:hypothetical protein